LSSSKFLTFCCSISFMAKIANSSVWLPRSLTDSCVKRSPRHKSQLFVPLRETHSIEQQETRDTFLVARSRSSSTKSNSSITIILFFSDTIGFSPVLGEGSGLRRPLRQTFQKTNGPRDFCSSIGICIVGVYRVDSRPLVFESQQ
jgi:hypothetical protein